MMITGKVGCMLLFGLIAAAVRPAESRRVRRCDISIRVDTTMHAVVEDMFENAQPISFSNSTLIREFVAVGVHGGIQANTARRRAREHGMNCALAAVRSQFKLGVPAECTNRIENFPTSTTTTIVDDIRKFVCGSFTSLKYSTFLKQRLATIAYTGISRGDTDCSANRPLAANVLEDTITVRCPDVLPAPQAITLQPTPIPQPIPIPQRTNS